MKKVVDDIFARPIATGIVICAVTTGIARIIRAARKRK